MKKSNGRAPKEVGARPFKGYERKVSKKSANMQVIKTFFMVCPGKHFTLKQLNAWTGGKDAGKCINALCRDGWRIASGWFDEMCFKLAKVPHVKLYWLDDGSAPTSINIIRNLNTANAEAIRQ